MSDTTTNHQLCKKVAQLTKVVARLNARNESYEAENRRLIEVHSEEVESLANEAKSRVEALQRELRDRENDLQHLEVTSKAKEEEARQQLILAQSEANARIEQLEANFEKEQTSHAHTSSSLRAITQSLEDQSRQHQENVLGLRKELTDEHKRRVKTLRTEISASHDEEISLLKSRHERAMRRASDDAADEQQSAVEDAVATTRLEYDQKLSDANSRYNATCSEVKALQEELETAKLDAGAVSRLRSELDAHIGSEKKLHAEVKRLQAALDTTSSTNQAIIADLQSQNADLLDEVERTKGEVDDCRNRVMALDADNVELKSLIDTIDGQRSALETELNSVSKARDEELHSHLVQIEARGVILQSLHTVLEDVNSANADLSAQLAVARDEIATLSRYKSCVLEALPILQSLRAEANQCRADTAELTRLFGEAVEKIGDWRGKTRALHAKEASRLKTEVETLRDEVIKLTSAAAGHSASQVEAKTTIASLRKKIGYLEESKRNAEAARTGERLSFEAAMEDAKKQHKREVAKVACHAQDEQDILGNQIAMLKDELKAEGERHERKCQMLSADWQRKVDDKNAALSRLKFESALEIQGVSHKLTEVRDKLAAKEHQCNSLQQNVEALREEQALRAEEAERKYDDVCDGHQRELEGLKHLHAGQIQQKEEDIERVKRDAECELASAHQQIDELNDRVASERATRASELEATKSQLEDLHLSLEKSKQEWAHCRGEMCNEFEVAQTELQQRLNATAEKHEEEMEQIRNAHSETVEALNQQIVVTTKEMQDAKSILYSTIREGEAKLERTVRALKEDHEGQLRAVSEDNKVELNLLVVKTRDLAEEYETLAKANARKVDTIIEREREINQLKAKISDSIKACEDEISSIRLQHEDERQKMQADLQRKDAAISQGAREIVRLQSTVTEVSQKLVEAEEKSSKSLPADVERIESLQHELNTLSINEREAREKMTYFKRELENRETNYNERFTNGDAGGRWGDAVTHGPLRVLQQDNAKPDGAKPTRQGSTARRKVSKKKATGGGGTRKKKAVSSPKLPKIAK